MFFDQLKNGWKLTFSSYRLYKLQKKFSSYIGFVVLQSIAIDCKTTNPELGISRKTDFIVLKFPKWVMLTMKNGLNQSI